MGKKLVKLYEFIDDEKGIIGKVEAAKLTKITQASAIGLPDTPANIELLTRAALQVTGKTPPVE